VSHITRRKSAIKSVDILKKACKRVPGAEYLGRVDKVRGLPHGGHQFKLKGWTHPVAIDINTGELAFDNYAGRWGEEAELDKVRQGYGVEAAKAQAEVEGHEFEEEKLTDGSIKCTIGLGGDGGYGNEGGGDTSGWGV